MLQPDPSTRNFFSLFRHVDVDASGKLGYTEFKEVVRGELKLSGAALGEERLKGLWLSLDKDCSGWVDVREFKAFMKLGDSVARRDPSRGATPKAE